MSDQKIDGPVLHRAAVAHAGELGTAAVEHAQAVKNALNLPDAPVSPHAPPPYPAPPYPAPPYPPVVLKSPSTPPPAEPEAPVVQAEPSQAEPAAEVAAPADGTPTT